MNPLDDGFQYRLNNIYGGVLAAPVFMFAMGVGVAYSRSAGWSTMFVRGLRLLVADYALNTVRCVDKGSMGMNLLCYPFVGIHVSELWSSFPLANWFTFSPRSSPDSRHSQDPG